MPTQSPDSDAEGAVAAVDRREVAWFLLVTYATSWIVWSPLLVPSLVEAMPFGGVVPTSLGAFGPAVGALAVVRSRGDGLRDWLGRRLRWRVGLRWYLLAFGLPLGILLAAGAAFVAAGGDPTASYAPPAYVLPVVFAYATVIGGGQEEFGWRGIAQPLFQGRYGVFLAGAVVGVLWALWHLPLFASSTVAFESSSPVAFGLRTVGVSVLLAWIYDGTGGSVTVAMLFHGWRNATEAFYPPDALARGLVVVAVWAVVAAVVIAERRRAARARSEPPAGETPSDGS